MLRNYALLAIAGFALAGCAASVKKGENSVPFKVGSDANHALVLRAICQEIVADLSKK